MRAASLAQIGQDFTHDIAVTRFREIGRDHVPGIGQGGVPGLLRRAARIVLCGAIILRLIVMDNDAPLPVVL
jgi:hypothetical protein